MANQEACELYIEQQIQEGLEEGQTPYHIGKHLSKWIEKLFETKINPKTIESRAYRQQKEITSNEVKESKTPDNQESIGICSNCGSEYLVHACNLGGLCNVCDPPEKFDSGRGGPREGAGRPTKVLFNDTWKVCDKCGTMTSESIEWARWTWNPVTGCLHGCKYCYARDIANRFYKEGFKPTLHKHRLKAPQNMPQIINSKNIGEKNVFVCSMADLFGDWVEQEWIDLVLKAVKESSQWNYLFLTKNPERLTTIDWPDNAWVGATIDVQERVERTELAFSQFNAKVKFISCEPLSEELTFSNMEVFDWVIIGARSQSSKMPAMQPESNWVLSILNQANKAGCKTYLKPNLKSLIKEYPPPQHRA